MKTATEWKKNPPSLDQPMCHTVWPIVSAQKKTTGATSALIPFIIPRRKATKRKRYIVTSTGSVQSEPFTPFAGSASNTPGRKKCV